MKAKHEGQNEQSFFKC